LYDLLSESNLIPKYQIVNKNEILSDSFINPFGYPSWIRDFSNGCSSGKASFKPLNKKQLNAWAIINPEINYYMLAEYLPHRNYACHLLYYKGKLLKVGVYERLDYFMKKVTVSGISGNISKGKLINNLNVNNNATKAIDIICKKNNEIMHGLIVVDLKEDINHNPLITEINLRHVAATSSFASAGFNLSEFHLLTALNRVSEIDNVIEKKYPAQNLILRDIDGLPVWITKHKLLKIGEYI